MKEKIRYAVLATSVSMIIFGASRGEVATVLKKAVKICLECIGIG